jgi:hypothetical protein
LTPKEGIDTIVTIISGSNHKNGIRLIPPNRNSGILLLLKVQDNGVPLELPVQLAPLFRLDQLRQLVLNSGVHLKVQVSGDPQLQVVLNSGVLMDQPHQLVLNSGVHLKVQLSGDPQHLLVQVMSLHHLLDQLYQLALNNGVLLLLNSQGSGVLLVPLVPLLQPVLLVPLHLLVPLVLQRLLALNNGVLLLLNDQDSGVLLVQQVPNNWVQLMSLRRLVPLVQLALDSLHRPQAKLPLLYRNNSPCRLHLLASR